MLFDTSLTVPPRRGDPIVSFVVRKEWREAKVQVQKETEREIRSPEGEWFTFRFSIQRDDSLVPLYITEISFMGLEKAIEMAARLLDPDGDSPEYNLTVMLAAMAKKTQRKVR